MKKNILHTTVLATLLLSSAIHAGQPTWLLRPSNYLSKYRNILSGYIASLASEIPYWIPSLLTHVNENLMFKLSEIKAKRVFWDTYKTVPAYQDYVDKNIKDGQLSCFSDIPLMSKKEYIEQYPIEQTIKGGKIPTDGFMDPSSGTSGRRTLWIRGKDEIKNTQKTMNLVCNMFLGNDNYVLINMFLPSAWYLGLMRGLGPNIVEAYETLKDLGTKPKYLIMGHTTLMKLFVKNCPLDLSQFDITFLLGGAHMSRPLNQFFLDKGIKRVYSGYGASDINFTVGIQEDFAQKLQDLCWNNPELQKDLTGSENGHPYFFQYSPLHYYIEEIDGCLIFTDLDHTRVSPRVRYDLGDNGKILKMSFVNEILKKHGIELSTKMNLPLVCLYGRVEHTVTFNGAELAFDDLEVAALETPELGQHMNQYAYNQYEDKNGEKHLELWVELKPEISAAQFNIEELEIKVLNQLCKINHVFKREFENNNGAKPVLKIFGHCTSPILEDSVFRKAKFVYNLDPSKV